MKVFNTNELLEKYSDIIYTGLLIRRVEEKILQLFSEGKWNSAYVYWTRTYCSLPNKKFIAR